MKPLLVDRQLLLKDSVHVKFVTPHHIDTSFHFHNNYEMVWVKASCGSRIVGDHTEEFTDGDLVILGPNLPHVWYNGKEYHEYGNTLKAKAIVTYFQPDWLTESLLNSAQSIKLRKLLVNMQRGIKIVGKTHKKITSHITKLPKSTSLKRIIRILSILQILADSEEYECLASPGYVNSFNNKDIEKIDKIDKIYQYVMTHYTGKIMLEDAANVVNMAPTSFCKYFKNRTQKTFSNFVNEIRIGYACKLLGNNDLSVSEICYMSGFNNITNFNRTFKVFTQKNPTHFRSDLQI